MSKIVLGNAIRDLEQAKETMDSIEASKLPLEEKKAAKRGVRNVWIFAGVMFGVLILTAVILAVLMINPIIIAVVAGGETLILIVGSLLILRNFKKAARTVSLGFDGKTQEEIHRLMPDEIDKKLLGKLRWLEAFWAVALLAAATLAACSIVIWKSKVGCIAGLIVGFVCYLFMDSCHTEVMRLKSGYYKRDFGCLCKRCGNQVNIPFQTAENYDPLPRNQSGIRMINCPVCGYTVELLGFDSSMKDYQKYLQKRNRQQKK